MRFTLGLFVLPQFFLGFAVQAQSSLAPPSKVEVTTPLELRLACDKMPTNLEALRTWTTGRGVRCELGEQNTAQPNAEAMCTADISKCVPPEVVEFRDEPSLTYGPNCWNLALIMSGILPARRHTTAGEMAFFMKSPLCRKLNPGEAKLPGDIGAFRAKGREVHGFVWVSEDLVFSKNGAVARKPYALQSRSEMESRYRYGQKITCRSEKTSCTLQLETLRCQSLDSYLQDPKNNIPSNIQEAFQKLNSAETCLSALSFKANGQDPIHRKNILESLEVLAAAVDAPEYRASFSSLPKAEQNFVQGSLLFRLNAMYHQMLFTRKEMKCDTCGLVNEELKAAAEAITEK